MLHWILLLLLLFILYFHFSKRGFFIEYFEKKEISNPIEYSALLYKNLENGILTKLKLHDKDVRREDCDEKCGAKECKIMYERRRNLDECKKCHKSGSNKCYRKSITGGNCEDCLEGEKQIKCEDVSNFGCVNPQNFFSKIGVDPYYVIKTSFSQNGDISQECRFCNDFTDLI